MANRALTVRHFSTDIPLECGSLLPLSPVELARRRLGLAHPRPDARRSALDETNPIGFHAFPETKPILSSHPGPRATRPRRTPPPEARPGRSRDRPSLVISCVEAAISILLVKSRPFFADGSPLTGSKSPRNRAILAQF